ncbi:unnamed protein product [Soboliphyme baturini]|uniref:ShKT domain-containing protein n=1 Tax=Soboliphyme baturini TaxID=241478 RepID=A0A183IT53_9BILA|nr:unnamed protein product [Soboliphyme baturini]
MHRSYSDRSQKYGFQIIGENIWWSNEPYLRANLRSIIRDLYSERLVYSYSTNQCAAGYQCGHYTQIVSAEACAVGCAAAYCPYIYYGRRVPSGTFFVCNYGPGVSDFRSRPYRFGPRCSECPSACRNGLCGECVEAREELCQPVSVSKPRYPTQWTSEEPQVNANVVHEQETSSGGSEVVHHRRLAVRANNVTARATGAPSRHHSSCTDVWPQCPHWASINECQRLPDYMRRMCPISCNFSCDSGVATQDTALFPTLKPAQRCECYSRPRNAVGECAEDVTVKGVTQSCQTRGPH